MNLTRFERALLKEITKQTTILEEILRRLKNESTNPENNDTEEAVKSGCGMLTQDEEAESAGSRKQRGHPG